MQSVFNFCIVMDIAVLNCVDVLKLWVVSCWDEERKMLNRQIDETAYTCCTGRECRATVALP